MKKGWVVFGIIVLFVIIIFGTYITNYNRLVTLNESIDSSWAQVENQYQRRLDLIPNLVNIVKGYAKHEKEIFVQVAEARSKLLNAKTTAEKVSATNELETVLGRLLAIAENYPNLKANENFIRLQDELAGTENRIAVERQRYNEVVRAYNILVQRFPSNIVASIAGFQKKDIYFKSEDKAKTVPKIEF
jgi:LemA protein